jgi:hypothetical protein
MKHTVTIRNKEFAISFTEVSALERFQEAEKEMLAALAASGDDRTKGELEIVRAQGIAMRDFAEKMFGHEVIELFENEIDLDELFSLYLELRELMTAQIDAITAKMNAFRIIEASVINFPAVNDGIIN